MIPWWPSCFLSTAAAFDEKRPLAGMPMIGTVIDAIMAAEQIKISRAARLGYPLPSFETAGPGSADCPTYSLTPASCSKSHEA